MSLGYAGRQGGQSRQEGVFARCRPEELEAARRLILMTLDLAAPERGIKRLATFVGKVGNFERKVAEHAWWTVKDQDEVVETTPLNTEFSYYQRFQLNHNNEEAVRIAGADAVDLVTGSRVSREQVAELVLRQQNIDTAEREIEIAFNALHGRLKAL